VSRADVLAALANGNPVDPAAMAIPPSYVAENASALCVFERLKSTPAHMLVVVDEFGSLLGLVTLADVLEAIGGDVTSDEGEAVDDEERPLQQEADGSYLVSGGYPVDDLVEAKLLPKLANQTYKTVAGLVLEHLRRLPVQGEVIDLPSLRIEVVSVAHGRIETLHLVRNQHEQSR
jgi:putative hemolysin